MSDNLLRENYKKLGLEALALENYNDAIKYFNKWQYVYSDKYNIDRYEYDIDMLKKIETLLSIDFKFKTSDIKLKEGEKIRIAYLVHTLDSPSAIMAKILLDIIKYHDTSKFDIHIFTLESLPRVMIYPGRGFIHQFKDANCTIHYAANFKLGFNKLLSIANEINKIKSHILVTCVALADFNHFFISALNPTPIKVGFVAGPPAQFISPSFDYGMSWFTHSIKDCPTKCLNTGIIYIPKEKSIKKLNRNDFGIPYESIIMISVGRHTKFQDKRLLNNIVGVMKKLNNLHYIIVMSNPEKIDLSDIPIDIRDRIHIFGWSTSYEDYLSISDIFIDTFPSGGGITIQDAALLKLPIISFSDDISKPFDQSDWNPAEDILPEDSLIIVDRYNISDIKYVIKRLYNDKELRQELGNNAYKSISSMRSNISDNIKNIENLYIKLVEEKL